MSADEWPVIGYVVGPGEDAVTVCDDCADAPEAYDGRAEIRDAPNYGEEVPYPECYVCGGVIRPG